MRASGILTTARHVYTPLLLRVTSLKIKVLLSASTVGLWLSPVGTRLPLGSIHTMVGGENRPSTGLAVQLRDIASPQTSSGMGCRDITDMEGGLLGSAVDVHEVKCIEVVKLPYTHN